MIQFFPVFQIKKKQYLLLILLWINQYYIYTGASAKNYPIKSSSSTTTKIDPVIIPELLLLNRKEKKTNYINLLHTPSTKKKIEKKQTGIDIWYNTSLFGKKERQKNTCFYFSTTTSLPTIWYMLSNFCFFFRFFLSVII